MENNFYTDGFEQLIKEKADQFSMYPSKRVWHSIYNNLHPSRRWPSAIMSLLLISSLSLIGYLHTGDNSLKNQVGNNSINKNSTETTIALNSNNQKEISTTPKKQAQPVNTYNQAFKNIITNETDFNNYTIVKSNRPKYASITSTISDANINTDKTPAENNVKDLIQDMDAYIKSNKLFSDIAVSNKKNKHINLNQAGKNADQDEITDESVTINNPTTAVLNNSTDAETGKLNEGVKNEITKINALPGKDGVSADEEKSWIENFALYNSPPRNKFKGRLTYQVYVTPAVNYRKLSSKTKGSTTAFANADINTVISQKPGLGIEAGGGLVYSLAKKLQLKAGLQFNYTNYNIDADQTNHPVVTTILLNDLNGNSYAAARTTTTTNTYNSTAIQPVTLHNRTYQVSLPVGMAYKLSSQNNVDWFAGASVQPTYVFGGNAHIISTDLKNYVSEPSTISTWNLNLGFETYMSFKLGGYDLQVGPQVRYQVFSTYRKNLAQIEKPYAIGLKLGLTKGF